MLSARWVPLVYVYTALATYFLAFAVTPGLVVWPSALGAIYPARPLFQIGVACTVLPHLTLVILWYVRTHSLRVLIAGISRFALFVAQTYITRSDDLQMHGVLSMVHDVSVGVWMMALYWQTRASPTARQRFYIFGVYAVNVLLSLHVLSGYLASGTNSSNGFYTVLRAIAFLTELGYDYVSSKDFANMFLDVKWVRSYTV